MNFLKKAILKHISYPLQSKVLVWGPVLRIFTDGGQPLFFWCPRIRKSYHAPYWGLRGWEMQWLGRQVFVVLGKDRNNLFKETNVQRLNPCR